VGIELHALGYDNIDGFDLSESMAEQAAATGSYQRVLGGIDMMLAADSYAPASYDAILSVGVFTLGHVPPEALQVLLQLTKADGLMVISTRTHYYDQSNYQQVVDDLIETGQVRLLQLIKDAPYNNDGDGHYWVFGKT
jgi:cyclopropane fatty-acyl-phospholipid synthase-like methyltransferase